MKTFRIRSGHILFKKNDPLLWHTDQNSNKIVELEIQFYPAVDWINIHMDWILFKKKLLDYTWNFSNWKFNIGLLNRLLNWVH